MIRWNVFDIVCVAISLLEFTAEMAATAARDVPFLGFLRLLRVARVVRVLRVVKVVKSFQGVRKLVIAVHGALLTLFWALILLALCMYIFTILMSSGITHYYKQFDPR